MEDIELQSRSGSTIGNVGSGSTSSDYHDPSTASRQEQSAQNGLGDDLGSNHSSLRSIASRMNAIFRLFLRSNTWVELLTSSLIFFGYVGYWLIFRTTACLFLTTDCPARIPPFNHPSCQFPAPLGQNNRWRPTFALMKLVAFSGLVYLLFLTINIVQLEVVGRFQLTGSCVLALTGCKRNFVICDEVYNVSRAEFNLMNHLLEKHFLQIRAGNLVAIPHPPSIVNMSEMTTMKALPQTSVAKDNELFLTSEADAGESVDR